MSRSRYTLLVAAAFPAVAGAADLTGILGPITPVYEGDTTGTSFSKPGWFPDSQFPFIWGGANEPDTNLSWWISRHSGGFQLDYTKKDGAWIPPGPEDSPDQRGYWIQSVYRPVDVKPELRGTTVTLEIYPDDSNYSTPPTWEQHVIDDNYLVGFTHIEDWDEVNKKEVNGSRTIYSVDNGKNWKKGPRRAMGMCAIDNRTNPGQPRLIKLWQEYQGPGWKTTTTDFAKGVDGYTKASTPFSHGNMYGVTGIVWSRYLNKWIVMFGFNGSHGKNLQFVTTDTFDSYSWEPSVSIEKNEVPGRGVVAGAGDYPTLLGGFPQAATYPMPFNMEMGQLGWIYNKRDGLSGRAIHFIAPVEKRIAWQGGDAGSSVAVRLVDEPLAARSGSITMNGQSVAALGDEDSDGVPNLIEYATGMPINLANKQPGALSVEEGAIHFDYTRDTAAQAFPVVEWSDTLLAGDWKTEGVTEKTLSSADGIEQIRASIPGSSTGKRFIRLRVTSAAKSFAVARAGSGDPVDLGGGVSLTVDNSEIPTSESAVWTFTRSGSITADLVVPFGVTGNAVFGNDYTVSGAAGFTASSGTVVIPAGDTSAAFTSTALTGDGKTIILSAPGALDLAGIGNWSQTTGSFNGVIDETHTLDFKSTAGGTFHNDIPNTKRVRSINFDAASGDHVINGNPIEIEAVNKWLSTGYANYSINQYAAKTATFNTDINTRSAALYLRSWTTGGKIELNGRTDMLGTGGVVVSGSGDVAINGDLVNSEYHDFITGQRELVAGVNPGRLIMAGDGVLSLAGNNTFAGRTEIKYGTVRVESPNALQNSVVTTKVHDGLASTTDFKLGGLDGYGNINLDGNDLTLGNHNRPDCYTTKYTGVIRGEGSVTKVDANTQRIGAINQNTGGFVLKGGVLEIPSSTRTAFGSGTLTLDGGTLKAVGAIIADNPIHVGSAGGKIDANGRTVKFNGPLSGAGTLNTGSTGTLILGSGSGTFSGTVIARSAIQVDQANAFGTGSLQLGGKLVLGADQLLSGLTTIAPSTSVDTGPYTLTIAGPISVASGSTFSKTGSGVVEWNGSSVGFLGNLFVNGGTFQSTGDGDFTRGNVTLNGATLSLGSSVTGSASIDIARFENRKLTVNGAASVILDKGTASDLTVNIGSNENPNALLLSDNSTVVVTLGAGTKFKVNGQLETPVGSIFSPAFLLAAPDRSGDFAAYSIADGFMPFTGYQARSGSWTASTGEISNITGATTLTANATIGGLRVDGTKALTLTSRVLTFGGIDNKAGLILNNGSLTGGAIDFGTNKGFIYVSGPNASIASAIRGSGGIVVAGAVGTKLKLTSWETTYSTLLTVAGTTLELPNLTVMGASGTPISLDGGGTLRFPNTLGVTRVLTFGSGGAGIEVAANQTFTNSGQFTGPGAFRKTGAGYLKFAAAGNSTGPVSVDEGTLEYVSTAIQGSTGPINVADGARVNISYTSGEFSHDLRIAGSGPNGDGALAIGGSGTTSSSITLTGDAKIQAHSGATFGIYGPIHGRGNSLKIGGAGRFGLHEAIDIEGGDLELLQTPYLSIKPTSLLVCNNLTTSANSTIELNTPNARVANAMIGGVLKGQKGIITVEGTVTIASGGTVIGGFQDTPDLFTVEGNLTMSDGAICHTYLKGATGAASDGTGSKHGQILVTGSGVVNGTLKLQRDAAYTPAAGDEIFLMLRNGGAGTFDDIVVIENGTTALPVPAGDGAQVTIGGKIGTIRYTRHSSINLSSPATAFDISIKFQ